jgi:hypothetical protein
MTAEQVLAQAQRCEAADESNAYQLGLCLRELSVPKRYRDELGFESFEALLAARQLRTRVTAHKLIKVVSTFSEAEVAQLGGTEKSFRLIRWALQDKPNGDPRRVLAASARVGGRAVSAVTTRDINRLLAGAARGPTAAEKAAAKKASSRLGDRLRSAGLSPRMRAHNHGGACVSIHLDPAAANQLASLLSRLKKLEKQLAVT